MQSVEYRELGSNQWPRGYEPRALPLRHPGEGFGACLASLALTTCFYKAGEV